MLSWASRKHDAPRTKKRTTTYKLMNKLGIVAGLLCFIYAFIYDYHVGIILLLYFIASKTDIVILIDKKIELLVSTISQKL